MPRLSQAILIHICTFPIENKEEDGCTECEKYWKCHHLNGIDSLSKHCVQRSRCLERCFVSSRHHSKPIESYKKHLPTLWTPDSFAPGLGTNGDPLQREQSWQRQLRNCSSLWQVNLLYYISKPHSSKRRQFHPGPAASQTQLCQAMLVAGGEHWGRNNQAHFFKSFGVQ